MAILSVFPRPVIDRALDPASGIAAKVVFLNLATIRGHLEVWAKEYWRERDLDERLNRKRLPEPERDPEAEARVAQGLRDLVQHLKSGFSPGSV